MIGSILDKYEVLQKLGEGATATVYRGRHLTIGRDVAIKVLHPHLSASSRNRERFNREARAVGRLAHQNIVSILDYSGQQADDCYIVTELIEGLTLLDLINEQGRLPSEIAALIGLELCAALAFAHHEGVIHRDIKPENIMIRRDGKVKLMDFGVARVLDEGSITLDGSLLGSPAYMSPQQALDESLDGRSDLFSLGTVLFHAVTGHVPFSGTNASVILRNIIEATRPEVLELAPAVSPSLAAVIDKLLQGRPDDRYPTADAVREALVVCLDEVGLGPDHPTINIRSFVLTPEACTTALDELLRTRLLALGKERLAGGDHLGALQLFNRLLALDEAHDRENAEVIRLIQSLHQPAETSRRPVWLYALGLGLGAFAVSVGVWWVSRPVIPPPPTPVVSAPAAPEGVAPPAGEAVTASETSPGATAASPSPSPATPDATAANPAGEPPVAPSATPVDRLPAGAGTGATGMVGSALPSSGRQPLPPTATPEATVAAAEPGRVTVVSSTWADVWVDGKKVGRRGQGPPSDWVGTRENPLSLAPGPHTLLLQNPYSEPWEESFVILPGEARAFRAELRRLPVNFVVNDRLPRDCTLRVGALDYGPVYQSPKFDVREPDPSTEIVFDCPAPLGRLTERIGRTLGGEVRVVPVSVPDTTAREGAE